MKHLNNQELQSALDKAMKLIDHQSTYTQDRLKMPAYIDKLQAEQIKRAESTEDANTLTHKVESGINLADMLIKERKALERRRSSMINPPSEFSDGFIPRHMLLEPLFRANEPTGSWEDQNNLLYDDDPLFDTQAFHRMMGISCVDYGVEE